MNQTEMWKRSPIEAALEKIDAVSAELAAEISAILKLEKEHDLTLEAPTLKEHLRQASRMVRRLDETRRILAGGRQ